MAGAGSASLRAQNRVPVAELTVAVVSPALHRAVLKDRAGVLVSRGDGDRGGDTTNYHRDTGTVRRAVAELADVVLSPALDRTVPQNRAGVEATGRDAHSLGELEDRHRTGRRVGHCAVTELTGTVVSPAPRLAVLEKRAGVIVPCRDVRGVAYFRGRELLRLTDGNTGVGRCHRKVLRSRLFRCGGA